MTVDWRALKAAGFSCFPLRPKDKRPSGPWEAYQQRHPTEQEIERWSKNPALNAAVVCGAISTIIVLDTDSVEADAEVQRRGVPPTVVAKTAKGRHYYFRHPGGNIRNFARRLPGCDLRGDGGYVVAPGSVHPSGALYEWVRAPAEAPILEAPTWLLELLKPPPETPRPPAAQPDGRGAPAVMSYAEKAMDYELAALRRAREGTRNDTLNRAAFNLGGLVGGGMLDQGAVERHLLATALAIGLPEKEAATTIASGLDKGIAQPRKAPEPRQRAAAQQKAHAPAPHAPENAAGRVPPQPPPESEPDPPEDRDLADLPRNDYGNGQRLVARHGHDLIHVDEAGWHTWSGRRWEPPLAKHYPEAVKRAHLTVMAIEAEAESLEPLVRDAEIELQRREAGGYGEDAIAEAKLALEMATKRVESHYKFAVASGNTGKVEALLQAAQPYCRKRPEELNADLFLLNVQNGTIRLGGLPRDRKAAASAGDPVELQPHLRRNYITHLSATPFDPDAGCPRFDAFMREIIPDPAEQAFILRWFGYCLSGDTREQRIVIFWGKGANGKSTLLYVIAAVLGSYAVPVPIETFLEDQSRRAGEATPDIVRLVGARLALASEPKRGARLSESVVKQATGGEKMTARKLFEGMFDFEPRFKLTLSVNEKPVIAATDHGTWRRVTLFPFREQFDEKAADRELKAALMAESSGILNRLLDGWRDYREKGLAIPDTVLGATLQYKRESDPIAQFMDQEVEQHVDAQGVPARVQASTLYQAYAKWAHANGLQAVSNTRFGRRLTDLEYPKTQDGANWYLGIRLKPQGKARADGDDGPAGPDPPPPEAER